MEQEKAPDEGQLKRVLREGVVEKLRVLAQDHPDLYRMMELPAVVTEEQIDSLVERATINFYLNLIAMSKRLNPTPANMPYLTYIVQFHNVFSQAEARGCVDMLMDGLMKIYEMLLRIPDKGKEGEMGHA